MTFLQLAQAVLGTTKFPQIDTMPGEARIEFAGCVSASVHKWLEIAPERYKKTKLVANLSGVETVDAVVEPDATATSEDVFDEGWRGRSLLLNGDDNWNEVNGAGSVLHAYRGATASTTATVYPDCWPIHDFSVERFTSDIILHHEGREYPLAPAHLVPRAVRPTAFLLATGAYASPRSAEWAYRRETAARPTHYSMEPVGDSRSDSDFDATFLVRFLPVPTQAFTVSTTMSLLALHYTIDSFETPSPEIPIPATRIWGTLIPLLREEILGTTLANPALPALAVQQITRKAREAEGLIAALPPRMGRSSGRWGIRAGY